MKTLYIIRHAKSSWDEVGLDDFDRPLSIRGKESAKLIGKKLKEKGINPDIIYSSPAKRAKKTIKKICKKIGFDKDKIKYDQNLYDYHMKGIDFYLSFIMGIKNKHKSAFLVGHNIAWSELAEYLLGKDIGNVPTAGVVCINFDIKSWKEVTFANGNLDFFIFPKMFK